MSYNQAMTSTTRKASVSLTKAEHARLREVAAGQGLSVSEYLRQLIRQADPQWQPIPVVDLDQLDMWGVPLELAKAPAPLPKPKRAPRPKRSVALQTRLSFT